jgi:hypothetical protein
MGFSLPGADGPKWMNRKCLSDVGLKPNVVRLVNLKLKKVVVKEKRP